MKTMTTSVDHATHRLALDLCCCFFFFSKTLLFEALVRGHGTEKKERYDMMMLPAQADVPLLFGGGHLFFSFSFHPTSFSTIFFTLHRFPFLFILLIKITRVSER